MAKIKDLPRIKKPKGAGHRKRLRTRFLEAGFDGFLDYEVVELLLTLGTPRKDCKQMAKKAIKKFEGLQRVLDASPEELQQVEGIGLANIFGLKLFQAVSERYRKEKIFKKIPLTSPEAVASYLREKLGRKKKEYFVVLSLDSRNNLIKISDVSIGTLNANLVHPREVFKEAILAHAAQIILAHNHPSGNPEPSPEDVALTRRLEEAAKIFGIELLDHIIVTKDAFSSLKEQNLI